MPKLVVMLRVKDGMFFVIEWLQCFEKIADEIVVLDNSSTDGTYEVLKAHPKVVDIIRTEGYNEGRDKNLLYNHVRKRAPDWCLWVDVDEIFEPELTRAYFDKLMKSRIVNKFAFRRFHFITREHFAGSWFRLNYSAGHDRIMWRENSSGYFENFIMDSPNVKGIKGLKWPTNYRLMHLGYINKEIVQKKAELYHGMIDASKVQNIQEMYMDNEKKMKWVDSRNSPKVVLLNALLNCLLMRQYYYKAISKVSGFVRNIFQKKSKALLQ